MKEFSMNYSLYHNTINLFGPIDVDTSYRVISQLLYLDNKFKTENAPLDERIITIQINSPGGSVNEGLAIYDTMNFIQAKIATVGIGMVASMAAFLLCSGTKGMRKATQNCEILIHQPLGGVSGQASDIMIAAEHIQKIKNKLNQIMAQNTGKSIETIQRDTDRDNIMDADTALQYGLIDMVIPSKKQDKER